MEFHGTMRVNEKGHLEIGGCDTVELAQRFGTPLWVMDEACIRRQCRSLYSAFMRKHPNADVAYASKAFLSVAMAAIIREEGLSLDVVSGGELFTALKAGFPADRIYFHGNNKSMEELLLAVRSGVGRIVVDNFYELDQLQSIAENTAASIPVVFRLTPGVEAHTHEYCKTGQEDSKFGFSINNGQAFEAIKRALESKDLIVKGIHCHIGSQIFEPEPFIVAAEIMVGFINQVYKKKNFLIEELNLGGGFGIYYSEEDSPGEIEAFADAIMETVHKCSVGYGLPAPKVVVEPGRFIVGPAGTTIYTVGSVKDIPGIRKYISVDGGMADNIRPALYGAKYEAIIANKAAEEPEEVVSVAGKCCESGDMLIWDIKLQKMEPGDILAIPCTGAYCYTMSSNYNRLPRPAVLLVCEGQAEVIVRRETYEDLIRNDLVPEKFCLGRLAHSPLPNL